MTSGHRQPRQMDAQPYKGNRAWKSIEDEQVSNAGTKVRLLIGQLLVGFRASHWSSPAERQVQVRGQRLLGRRSLHINRGIMRRNPHPTAPPSNPPAAMSPSPLNGLRPIHRPFLSTLGADERQKGKWQLIVCQLQFSSSLNF